MTKAIIFDLWGTLLHNGVKPSPNKQIKSILGLEKMDFSEFIFIFEEAFMTQKNPSMENEFKKVCKTFLVKPEKELIDKMVKVWKENKSFAKPFPETIEVLDGLKKKYKLILLSNTDGFLIQKILKKYDMEKYFEQIVLSCNIGMLKPNPDIFKLILEKNKLKKEEVVMVGDSMISDIEGAKEVGIKGILIDLDNPEKYELIK
ncbi:HAD family hydrolase [Nanoarchaeota archaeon]